MTRFVTTIAIVLLAAVPSAANTQIVDGEAVERGRAFAQENCARCHAIGLYDASPLPPAPPLRELQDRYPVENLAEAFAEGITVGHPAMPEFELDPPVIDDLLSFIESL